MLPLQEPVPLMALSRNDFITVADLEDLFLSYKKPLTTFIFSLIGNRDQAEDLSQDTFLKAYKALISGTQIQAEKARAWIYRIAANTAKDVLRRRRLITWMPLSLFYEDRGIGAGVPNGEWRMEGGGGATLTPADPPWRWFDEQIADRELIARIFRRLRPGYACCLWLYEQDGLSCPEIAEVICISTSAVKMRLVRAREQFRDLYQQETGEKYNERGRP